jgi:hypothetical protein
MRFLCTNLVLAGIALFCSTAPARSQDTNVDSTHIKINQLEKQLDALSEKIDKKEQQDELQKLIEEARKLKSVEKKQDHGIGKKFHTGVRQQSGLNPNISVSGDFFGAMSSKDEAAIKDPSDYSYGNNGLFLRELEMSFVAPLDPFTRGKSFISVTEKAICIEEAYLEWLNLPLNMNVKLGIFNAEFGILNRYHDHALPQFDRPKVLTNFFTNGNFGGTGIAANFLLPALLGADAIIFDVTLMNGGAGVSFTNSETINMVAVGNFTNFYDITESTFFEWRLGAITGYNDVGRTQSSVVGNMAFNLKWIPTDRAKYRTLDWKTEFLYGHRNTPIGTIKSTGLYSSLQNKLNASWWLFGRIDYSQLPTDADQHEWAFTFGTDFWQSDFVFLRWQYQYSRREFDNIYVSSNPFPSDHSTVFQVNWAMGPHKHEAY